jgi:hypothetical protein
MSHTERTAKRQFGTAGVGRPAWCAFDHGRYQQRVILQESLPVVIEISAPRDDSIPEWIDVHTAQPEPEDSDELPPPPAVELSYGRGHRYRVTTPTAKEARQFGDNPFRRGGTRGQSRTNYTHWTAM